MSPKNGVSDKDKGWKRIQANLALLQHAVVDVGVQGDEDSHLVKVASIHEFGSREWTVSSKQAYFMARRLMGIDPVAEPGRFWGTYRSLVGKKMQIPERSYLRASFDSNVEKYREAMRRSWDFIVTGKRPTEVQLRRFGEFVQGQVQAYMVRLKRPPNAPLTRFVKNSSNPLIDKGRLHASIRYVVRFRGGPS